MHNKKISEKFGLKDELYFFFSERGSILSKDQIHSLILNVDGVDLAIKVYHILAEVKRD